MKTRILKFGVILFLISISTLANGQSIFSDDFEDGSLTTNPVWVNNTTNFLPNNTSPVLAGTKSLRSNTTNAVKYIYNKYISSGSLSTTNMTWRFLYRNNNASLPASIDKPAAGNASWRYWLAADGADPSTAGGYALIQKGNQLILNRYTSSGGINAVTTAYTFPTNNTVYSIKVTRRASDGLWVLYVNAGTAEATTATSTGGNYTDVVNGTQDIYTILEANDNNTSNRFVFDNLSITRSALTISCNNSSSIVTNAYSGNTYALYSFQATAFEDVYLKFIYFGTNQSLSGGADVSGNAISLVRSVDNDYSTTADNTDITSTITAGGGQAIAESSDLKFYNNNTTGITIANGTSYYYFVVMTINNPITGTIPSPTTISIDNTTNFGGVAGSFQPSANNAYNINTYTCSSPTPITFTNLYDWTGASSAAWETPSNWTPAVVPGSADLARIGVKVQTISGNTGFNNQPTISDTRSCAAITFGDQKAVKLTVTGSLTVSGDITQNHTTNNTAIRGTLTGSGTITCKNVNVGNSNVPANNSFFSVEQDSTTVSTLVSNFNILGNINLLSTASADGSATYFPVFNLDANTTTLTGQIVTSNNANATSSTYNSTLLYRGRVNANHSNNTNSFILKNLNPIATVAPYHVIDFNAQGSTNGTVNYDQASNGQVIYTAADAIGNAGGNYYNLTLTGTGTKIFDGTSCSITGSLSTSGGAVNLNTNDPAVTITGNWTNSTNVTQDAGNIAVSGNYSSSAGTLTLGSGSMAVSGNATVSGGAITGSTSSASLAISGTLTNSGTITCNAQNIAVSGNATNNSVITGGAGTLTFAGTYSNTTGSSITTGAGTATFTGAYTNTAGAFTAGAGSVIYKNNYTNTGTFTAGSGTVYFNNGAQALVDNSTGATIFNNVNFNGSSLTTAIKTMSGTGGFGVSATGILTMANATTKLDAGGVLTLMSNATSTASVDIIPSGAVITGNVNVQRYLTGGAGYRGYRLISSPVNINSITSGTGGNIGLAYINTSKSFGGVAYNGALTGGKGTGFTVSNNNPSLYLYDETKTTNNTTFVAGKNVGIYSIAASTVTTISGVTQTSGVSIPVGNSLLFFFIGDNSNTTNLSAATRTPENTTVTATGYLNQNNVPVKFWKANSTTIPYTVGTGSILPGYNQVGNPYASTINLDVVYSDNYNATTNAISPIFWEMNEPGQTYISYNASSHATSNTKASKYIVSGQGFIIDATLPSPATQTITFKEDQKIAYPTGFTKSTTPALLMSTKDNIALVQSTAAETPLTGLHLQITKDSAVNTQCGIYFNKSWNDAYKNTEDGLDLDGASPKVYMSSYSSDGVRTAINQLADYKEKGKRIKLFVNATASSLYHIDLADIHNFDTVNYKIYLVDKLKKDSLDIGRYKTYAFNLVTSDTTTFGANRFELSINQIPASKYQLATFTAQKATDGVLLTWRTHNEGGNYFFTLEKQQANGTDYSPLYNIQSNGSSIYKYTDKAPNTGNNVYRLKQVDLFGNITYSNPVNINYDKSGTEGMFSVYPNPTAETLNVNITYGLTTTAATSYKLNIYDATGSLVMQKTSDASKWSENVSQFKPGIYIVELKGNSGISLGKTKFVKQ